MTTGPDPTDVLRARLRQQSVDNYKRLALTLVITLSLLGISLRLGSWGTYTYAAVAFLYVIGGIWAMRGGRCVVCHRRANLVLPPHPYEPRAWWDLRYPSREGITHVCMEHVMQVMTARVETMIEQSDLDSNPELQDRIEAALDAPIIRRPERGPADPSE